MPAATGGTSASAAVGPAIYVGRKWNGYRSNIQVADMNMCNAAHAVICWKQYRCFYLEHKRSHHRVYTVFDQRLHLNVTPEKTVE